MSDILTSFKNLNPETRINAITDFLLESKQFNDYLVTKFGNLPFKQGDLARIKGTDTIVKIRQIPRH